MQEETAPKIAKGDALQRLTGSSFIVGAVLSVVAGLLHPQPDDRTDLVAGIQEIGDTNGGSLTSVWALVVGIWVTRKAW